MSEKIFKILPLSVGEKVGAWQKTGLLLLTSAAVAKNPIRCQAPGGIAVSAEKNQFKPLVSLVVSTH